MASAITNPVRWIANDCKIGGWGSDLAKGASLFDFWMKQVGGGSTADSVKITSAGEFFKRGFDALAVFVAAADAGKYGLGLLEGAVRDEKTGEFIPDRRLESVTRRVSEFGGSLFTLGKHSLDFFGFFNKVLDRDVFFSKEALQSYSWVSSVSAVGFGVNQIVFDNVPELHENMTRPEGKPEKAFSAFLKLVKHTALVGVGALALIAAFYCPIPAIAIPILLTVALAASMASRFFDGLVLPSAPRGRAPEEPVDIMTEFGRVRDQIAQLGTTTTQQIAGLANLMSQGFRAQTHWSGE